MRILRRREVAHFRKVTPPGEGRTMPTGQQGDQHESSYLPRTVPAITRASDVTWCWSGAPNVADPIGRAVPEPAIAFVVAVA